jgi:hypothetical protein|tara:strand:+ start:402 stop:1010 length:609 start_codon:yes stop_codon:yes gene_type:complete
MNKMKFTKITIILCFLLNGQSYGQGTIELENLNIDAKQNGLFLAIHSSGSLSMEKITGWVNGDWFYMTVHEAQGDSAEICSAPYSFPVLEIDNTNTEESTQLAIRVSGQIENFELYLSEDKHTIIAALYYPAETVIALMEKTEKGAPPPYSLNSRIINVLYLTGTALTISGVISGDGSDNNTELVLGLSVLTCTYLYDRFLK